MENEIPSYLVMTLDLVHGDRIAAAILGVDDHAAPHGQIGDANHDRHMQPQSLSGLRLAFETAVPLYLGLFDAVDSGPSGQTAQENTPKHIATVRIPLHADKNVKSSSINCLTVSRQVVHEELAYLKITRRPPSFKISNGLVSEPNSIVPQMMTINNPRNIKMH